MAVALIQEASRDLGQFGVGYLAETQFDPFALVADLIRDRWHPRLFEGRVQLPVRQAANGRRHGFRHAAQRRRNAALCCGSPRPATQLAPVRLAGSWSGPAWTPLGVVGALEISTRSDSYPVARPEPDWMAIFCWPRRLPVQACIKSAGSSGSIPVPSDVSIIVRSGRSWPTPTVVATVY